MATGFKRETMIALRARRSAHRIACDFLYPHVETPAPPQPTPFAFEAGWKDQQRVAYKPQPRLTFLAIVLWIVAITYATLAIMYHWKCP